MTLSKYLLILYFSIFISCPFCFAQKTNPPSLDIVIPETGPIKLPLSEIDPKNFSSSPSFASYSMFFVALPFPVKPNSLDYPRDAFVTPISSETSYSLLLIMVPTILASPW